MNLISICDRIRALQEAHGVSGAELARRCNVAPQQVSRWRVQRDIKIGSVLKVCAALGVSINDMLRDTDLLMEAAEMRKKMIVNQGISEVLKYGGAVSSEVEQSQEAREQPMGGMLPGAQ